MPLTITTARGPVDLTDEAIEAYERCLDRAFAAAEDSNCDYLTWQAFKTVCWIAGANKTEAWGLVNYGRRHLEEVKTDNGLRLYNALH